MLRRIASILQLDHDEAGHRWSTTPGTLAQVPCAAECGAIPRPPTEAGRPW